MADKTYNLPLGDGAIEVPAWATESTLEALSNQSSSAVRLTSKLLSTVTKNGKLDDDIIEAVKTNTQIGVTNAEANSKEASHRSSLLLKGAQTVRDTAGFFGDSEKPLSSMVSAAEKVVGSLKGTDGKLSKASKDLIAGDNATSEVWKKIGGVAVDIGFAWAGWNAAKFEQFAEVQKSMINSGAIVFETADAFDELYTDAFKSGITYKTFADVVANFGGTMVGLGGNVSTGSQNMMKLFKRLEVNADEFGDFGLTNKELLNTYAQYIETQRLTGSLDRKLADGGELLEAGYKELMVESTALASLTALDRSDIYQKQMSALSDVNLAAGTSKLEDQGLQNTSIVAQELVRQLAVLEGIGPSDFVGQLTQGISRGIAQYSENPENFDIRQVISGMDQKLVGQLEYIMPGLFDTINSSIINAEETNGQISETLILDAVRDFKQKRLAAVSAANTDMGNIQDIQSTAFLILEQFKGATNEAYLQAKKDGKKNLDASGEGVEAINELSKMFLTAQEFITLPMQDFGEKMDFVSGLLGDGASFLNNLFNDYTGENDAKAVGSKVLESAKDAVTEPFKNNGTTYTGVSEERQAEIKTASMPELLQWLTDNEKNAKIIENESHPHSKTARREIGLLNRENDLIEAQVKMLEEQVRRKQNIQNAEEARILDDLVNG